MLHQAGSYGKAVMLPNLLTNQGDAGACFAPNDPHSLAAAIALVVDDPEYRHTLETQNLLATHGRPMRAAVDWYLLHMQPLVAAHHCRSTR